MAHQTRGLLPGTVNLVILQTLPIGVHFVARFGDEACLLRLAGQLEQAKPWFDRLPELVTS